VNETQTPIPYRIRIGVTGHRNLPTPDAASALVSQALDTKLNDLFDDASRNAIRQAQNTPVLLSIVSPLAEGSDCLVAVEALKREGARLDAVLPLEVSDYLESFGSEESRLEFQVLLHKCREPRVLRRRLLSRDFSTEQIPEARRRAYAEAGRYVVDHCDVLIAIWDGEPPRGIGGTAEVVAYAREQNRPLIRIWPEDAEPIQISKGNGLNATSIVQIDEFNQYRVETSSEAAEISALDQEYFGKNTWQAVPDSMKNAIRQTLFPFYFRASLVAKQNQERYRRAGTYGYLLPSFAVVAVALGALIPEMARWAFPFELAILAVALTIVGAAHRQRSAEKWVESRFLTERLRAAIYMAGCGVEVATIAVPPHLGESEQPDDWMLRVFEEVWNRMPPMPGCAAQDYKVMREYIAEQWVDGQIKFHDGKSKRESGQGARLYWFGRILLFSTVVAAAWHILLRITSGRLEAHSMEEKILTFVALAFPALASAFAGLRSHREYVRLENRSRNMSSRLRQLKGRVLRTATARDFEIVLREIEATMLQEAQDWLMLMHTATIDPA
jgi:hypothetical protein